MQGARERKRLFPETLNEHGGAGFRRIGQAALKGFGPLVDDGFRFTWWNTATGARVWVEHRNAWPAGIVIGRGRTRVEIELEARRCSLSRKEILERTMEKSMNKASIGERRRKSTELAVVDGGKSGAARERGGKTVERPRERLLNAAEAAAMLGLAIGTIRNLTYRGELECVHPLPGAVRYRESTLLALIERNTIHERD